MTKTARVLYCHCAYAQVVPKAVKEEVLAKLADSGIAFDAVADLCEMSAKGDPSLEHLVSEGELRIAACYPRAVRWLFSAAGQPLPETGVQILNMRTESAETVVQGLLEGAPAEEVAV